MRNAECQVHASGLEAMDDGKAIHTGTGTGIQYQYLAWNVGAMLMVLLIDTGIHGTGMGWASDHSSCPGLCKYCNTRAC